ncbi:MAG: two-component system, sensor histidine kinase YesM [Clostridiales bacterium]|nr:two-component system, sensor histidine kinase YesM [Clostridiales bacterium]
MKRRVIAKKKNKKMIKLTSKFTILILAVLMVPVGAFLLLIFNNMETSLYEDGKKQMLYELSRSSQNVEQIVVNCNLSTQMIVNDEVLNDFLNQLKSNTKFGFMDMLDFYGKEISGVQKVVKSNPYIYKIRIFVNSDSVRESVPLLYKKEKIKELKWGKSGTPQSGTWCFDYEDTLDQSKGKAAGAKIAAVITELKDYRYGQNGIVEVSVRMKEMFPDLYQSTDLDWSCFVDSEGMIYTDASHPAKWDKYRREVTDYLKEIKEKELLKTEEHLSLRRWIGKEEVLIGCQKIDALDGYLVRIVSVEKEKRTLNTYKIEFLILWILIVGVLLYIASRLVNHILKQFYEIYEVVYQVQQGDMEVRIKNASHDEFGALGVEINTMLDRVQTLMDETIKRELIVKDSQIKALQNQINAHFIYNVLESVKMMAEIDEKYEIADALSSFGKLLRYSMKWKSQYVEVKEEIEHIRNYLAMLNLWYEEEIQLVMEVSEDIQVQKIPKISLQPIIENAIFHGMQEMPEVGQIDMKGYIHEGSCYIQITDKGRGMNEEELERLRMRIQGELEDTHGSGNGIGLKNVQDRIQIAYGKEYGIEIASKEGEYTTITVKIPYVNKEDGV